MEDSILSSEVDYIDIARKKLEKPLSIKLESLTEETQHKINSALNHIECTYTSSHLEDNPTDIETEALKIITPILKHDDTCENLSDFPAHMKLRLELFQHTPRNIKKVIRNQVYQHSLKTGLLLHLAETTDHLREVLGLQSDDIRKLHERRQNKINRTKSRGHRNKHYHKGNQAELKISKGVYYFVQNGIRLDHVRAIIGTKDLAPVRVDYDHAFPNVENLLWLNSSENLFLLPTHIDEMKANLMNVQINVHSAASDGRLFLNMIPEKGPEQGAHIYQDSESFFLDKNKTASKSFHVRPKLKPRQTYSYTPAEEDKLISLTP